MTATIDQQFVEFIVKALVSNPDKVEVKRTIDEKGVLLELTVDPEDLGRVIGRGGMTAKSIRTLLRALGVKNDARYNLKVVDTNGGGRPAYNDTASASGAPASDQPDEPTADEPAEEPEVAAEAEPEVTEEEDVLARHREELEDLRKDLEI